MFKEIMEFVAAYLAIGILFRGCLGGPRSTVAFIKEPTLGVNIAIVLIWPLLLISIGAGR